MTSIVVSKVKKESVLWIVLNGIEFKTNHMFANDVFGLDSTGRIIDKDGNALNDSSSLAMSIRLAWKTHIMGIANHARKHLVN